MAADAKALASSSVVNALAGAAGGVLSFGLTYPLLTISARLQAQSRTGATITTSDDRTRYDGALDALAKILRHEGLKGLFAGLGAGVFAQAISQGIYYYWYALLKAKFEARLLAQGSKTAALPVWANLVIAAIAGSITTTMVTPAWVVNTRAQLADADTKPSQRGVAATVRSIIRQDGVRGLWRGLVPSLILVINPVIQYSAFERLKGRAEQSRGGRLSPGAIFLLGAIAKAVATVCTYPYILCKTRLQMKQGSEEQVRYSGTWDALRKIVRHEGPLALYKGMGSKIFQSVLTASFLFFFQEQIVRYTVTLALLWQRRNARPIPVK